MFAVEVQNLTKDFASDFWKPTFRGLEDVSFAVPDRGVFGLIGHNGAGKTTTIKILLGLLRPTKGEARIYGHPVGETTFKSDIGYLPENAYYYDFLRAWEVLDFYGRLFNLTAGERMRRIDELLDLVGLKDRRNEKLRNFSKGMLQRIGIAQSLINHPRLVILDEPMSGLDPIGRKEVKDIIVRLTEEKKTIMFSSHILSDVEAICDQVAILVRGRLKAVGALSELVHARTKAIEVAFETVKIPSLPGDLASKLNVREAGGNTVFFFSEVALLQNLLDWGRAKELKLVSVIPHQESLEDLFLKKTGESS